MMISKQNCSVERRINNKVRYVQFTTDENYRDLVCRLRKQNFILNQKFIGKEMWENKTTHESYVIERG